MERDNCIPIVLATDDNYAMYCYIAIFSIIKFADADKLYKIFVFETELTKESIDMLNSLSDRNISVECINIKEKMGNVHLERSIHLSIETYYRLFIPLVLPQYKRVLYIDTDMIIFNDVGRLFDYELEGKPVGVVADVPTYYMKDHSKEIGMRDGKNTFNAGLLLMDTACFEREKIREKCLSLLSEDYKREKRVLIFADQDALNVVLENNVAWFDPRWNYQVQYLKSQETVLEEFRTQYVNSKDDAFIYHFAGTIKPWNNPKLPKADLFWSIVKETDYLTDMINKELENCRNKNKTADCFERWRFPYERVAPESKIVIYAAGRIGTVFYEQMVLTNYAKVVLRVDRAWERMEKAEIEPVERVCDVDFDTIVVAVKNENSAKEAEEMLISLGVDKNKIIWQDYRC